MVEAAGVQIGGNGVELIAVEEGKSDGK